MKTTVKLTLDGLVRALRVREHALADDAERGYRSVSRPAADRAEPMAPTRRPTASREPADDRSGR